MFPEYGRQKGWERDNPKATDIARSRKNPGGICGGHGADGASLSEKSHPVADPVALPLPGRLPGNPP